MIMVQKNFNFTMSLPEILNKIPSTNQNKSFENKQTKQNKTSKPYITFCIPEGNTDAIHWDKQQLCNENIRSSHSNTNISHKEIL